MTPSDLIDDLRSRINPAYYGDCSKKKGNRVVPLVPVLVPTARLELWPNHAAFR